VAAQEAACAHAPSIGEGAPVHGSTIGAGDRFPASCGTGDALAGAPDRVYKVTLASRRRVQVKLDAPLWQAVVAIRRSCADPTASTRLTEAACSAEQRPPVASLDVVLDAGSYFITVDGGAPGAEGAFTLSYKTVAP
jgi:hypothetical protein